MPQYHSTPKKHVCDTPKRQQDTDLMSLLWCEFTVSKIRNTSRLMIENLSRFVRDHTLQGPLPLIRVLPQLFIS